MSIQAFIFDLDGTLLDTLDDLADAANTALQELGYPTHPVDAYRTFVGSGIEILFRQALPYGASSETIHRAVALMENSYATNWKHKTRPYAGILPILHTLHYIGFPLAILSNKPHAFTKLMVEHFFPQEMFAMVEGAKAHIPRKPDPTSAFAIATTWNIDPRHIAFVGDSNVDMQTANAANMLSIGCAWGFRGAQELREASAAYIIDTPLQLFQHI